MIKFWKEDFKYIKRTGYSVLKDIYDEHQYHFSVIGETALYLMNKYDLFSLNIKIHVFDNDYVTVTSHKTNKETDVAEIDVEDREELMVILNEFIEQDKSNYEEYLCNDLYRKDDRWE